MTKPLAICALGAALVAAGAAGPASADAIADFYKGKTMTMIVGAAAGGGYDLYGRLISRHMGKYVPGHPGFITKNMPGSGAIKAANFVYGVARQDGTVIGGLTRTTAFAPIFGQKGPQFDPVKLQWLGSLNNEAGVVRVLKATGVASIGDARRKSVILGATAPGTDTSMYPALLNNTLGTRFRIVTGYISGPSIDLAIQRGEVFGQTDSVSSMRTRWPKWREKFNVLAQLSLTKHPALPDIPLILDFIKPENLAPGVTVQEAESFWRIMLTQKVMGRPFTLGPGVPADKVKALRTAFDEMLKDAAFLADAKRQRREVVTVSGADIQDMITRVAATPRATIAKLKDALKYRGKVIKAKVKLVTDKGKVLKSARGGRVITFDMAGKKLKARISGRSTKVLVGGKRAKRSAIKAGMTCTFLYPGPGTQAKEVSCSK